MPSVARTPSQRPPNGSIARPADPVGDSCSQWQIMEWHIRSPRKPSPKHGGKMSDDQREPNGRKARNTGRPPGRPPRIWTADECKRVTDCYYAGATMRSISKGNGHPL